MMSSSNQFYNYMFKKNIIIGASWVKIRETMVPTLV